jgi:hypothetical protein
MALTRKLERVLRERDLPSLPFLFTPHCRHSCTGFLPFVVTKPGGSEAGEWLPRLKPGGLLGDLALILMSYSRWEVELQHLEMRAVPRQVLLRSRLTLRGEDLEGGHRVDQGLVDLDLRQGPAGWKIHRFTPVRVSTLRREMGGFDRVPDAAATSGASASAPVDLTLPGRHAGAPWVVLDVDRDGTMELVTVQGRRVVAYPQAPRGRALGPARLLIGAAAAGAAPIRVLQAGDLDGDGLTDLFVGSYGGVSRLWLQRGDDGRFSPLRGFEVTGHVTSAVIGDFTGDGRLDLYVVRHGAAVSQAGEPNLLFEGAPGGGLKPRAGAGDRGPGLAACAGDLDNDGDLDLFVANEIGPSALYLNQGDGGFVEASRRSGLILPGLATACALGDVNGDGWQDLFVGGRGARRGYLFGRPGVGSPGDRWLARGPGKLGGLQYGSTLWINRGTGATGNGALTFRRVVLGDPGWITWVGMLDHDSDGQLDLLAVERGLDAPLEERWWWEVLGPALRGREPAGLSGTFRAAGSGYRLWVNLGRERWIEAASVARLPRMGGSAGPVWFDVDGNGGPELVLARKGKPVVTRWEADEESEHSVFLRFLGRQPNRAAVGSRVELWVDGRRQIREVGLGAGLPGGPPGFVHFGVGRALRADQVVVRWADGEKQRYTDLPVDCLVTLRKGGGASWAGQEEAAVEQGPGSDAGSDGTTADEAAVDQGPGFDAGSDGTTADEDPAPAASSPSPGPLLPARLLQLTVRGSQGPEPLSRYAGERATLILVDAGSGSATTALCAKLSGLAASTPGVRSVLLQLGPGGARSSPCSLPRLVATAATARALSRIAALLPAVAVVDAKGVTGGLLSGGMESASLEVWLEERLRREP